MKIACYVHPLVHKLGPCFDEVWSELFAGIMQCLHREAHCECLLITGNWFKGCPGLPTIRLNEVSLYQKLRALGDLPTSLEAAAYLVDELDHPAYHVIAEEVARRVENFSPDIVLGVGGHANYLAKLWPPRPSDFTSNVAHTRETHIPAPCFSIILACMDARLLGDSVDA